MTTTDRRGNNLLVGEITEDAQSNDAAAAEARMKILLVGNYEPDNQASMRAFLRVLERELPNSDCELRVTAPRRWLQRVPPSSRLWKWLGYLDKFVLFVPTLAAQARWADVVHICDHSNSMYVRWIKGRPTLVTCHDVIAVQAARGMVEGWSVGWSGRVFQRLISSGLAKADLIACVSPTTQRALLDMQLAEEDKVTTVLNGLNESFSPMRPEEADSLVHRFGLGPRDTYLIHVGSDLPRKNRQAVLETFIALKTRAAARGAAPLVKYLVFVGPELDQGLMELASRHGVAEEVRTLQEVAHEELRALYARATALVFPSLQEGFGWPLIEAQACGCPVFASDLPPMNEIGGRAARYIDPRDPQAMATAIEDAAGHLDEMRALGLQNALQYSAAQMMANYVAAYRRLLEARRCGS
ncbi:MULTISPECIES: glycosyltransferase family 1 protein [unclassified Variovorax]|uniref:glycosyltransferase family 4 protein n=1 Tax=unclassified Variovorax TaxID=663243 RepID=UPI00076C1543|nr:MULTISPECIES: glycosyltransferase family 1 protein [unclassified Variovorax]KWT68534.1 mannosyltransferase [Variovorax sp. WDL1]PNG46654.1 D-inositol 3-phosphate glycosyltransferase [Variovorax sp. B2]PNG48695.1 D-inositol 3-phosphate glycosyltransferase [Variovorax sp. B4]VTV14439.1 GDP-mannose-dependent alpha-(1-6)-phosphatidylinositol monomannoside mannosyltransferase [Variovorax sp. WDL1]